MERDCCMRWSCPAARGNPLTSTLAPPWTSLPKCLSSAHTAHRLQGPSGCRSRAPPQLALCRLGRSAWSLSPTYCSAGAHHPWPAPAIAPGSTAASVPPHARRSGHAWLQMWCIPSPSSSCQGPPHRSVWPCETLLPLHPATGRTKRPVDAGGGKSLTCDLPIPHCCVTTAA